MWRRCACFVCLAVLVGLIPGAAFGAWNFLEDEALVGYWPLDEGEGAVAADISGNGYDGVFFGDPNWVPGAFGTALELDGDDYVDTGMVTDLANFTVAIWVKSPAAPEATTPSGPIHREANFQINWNHTQDAFRGAVGLSAGGWHGASFGALDGETWYHLAGTYDGEDLKAYTNGVLISTNDAPTGPAASEVNSLKLGRHAAAASQYFTGVVDDAQVYDRALTEEEIQAIMGGLAAANLAAWENAVAEASPAFFATNVEDGVYDIGELGGEITYEFVVQSNPEEVQASMCLIGRRDFGDVQAGLKYEQWNNTGTYGATIFGVADYDFGVANDPGAVTHLAFVSSEEMGVTDLYVNGAYQGSVASAITLSGLVGIGYGAQDREDADPFFDDFDGEIFAVAVYDSALSLGQIRLNADAYFQNGPSDITSPGDVVQGVPNDGDWPGAETPDLAIDDNVNTKYLHFKGATEPTGFQVTPALGATLVTGLTLTTANDAVERDPIVFELYGSNESIDGPYALIASGEVADFNQVDAWPRFTMNATPITFENVVAYKHYQILFPAVRDPASANSMQIAEVELIGVPCLPRYTYDGGALDDRWEHDNGSDAWDGTGPGEGGPGGVAAIVEEDVTFLRVQDTGDPRDYGMPDPSNRKIYLTHPICASLDGAHLEVAIRVATGAGLDDLHPDGGAGISPWPEAGIGYHIRDDGKGMVGVSDGSQIISFSLAKAGEIAGLETDALVMNNLIGMEPSGDVDTGDAGVANVLAIADATAWNDIVIDIVAGGAGTHVVTVSVNGEVAQSFEVTAGTGTEKNYGCIAFGSSGTGAVTAFDVDYLSVTN